MESLKPLALSPFWHPYTAIPPLGEPEPLRKLITQAKGAFVFDSEGKQLFDGTSSWWCQIHGHGHERLAQALYRQAQTLDQVLVAPHSHPVAEEFSHQLIETLGKPFSKIFFSDNGSTAVEIALKMALQFWQLRKKTGKTKFLHFDRGYHGDTLALGALDGTSVAGLSTGINPLLSVSVSSPYCYRCPIQKTYPSCQIECVDSAIAVLKERKNELAAIVLEPLVLGAGGMVMYPKEYLEKWMQAAEEAEVLVIFDEVFTGFGRTGTMFAFEQLQRRPDFVCLSKGLTSGMLPLAVTVAQQRVFEEFIGGKERRFSHGHTFSANGLGTAVALESLKIFQEEKVLNRNLKLIEVFSGQKERFLQIERVGEVRHLGMIWAIELVEDRKTKKHGPKEDAFAWKVAYRLWEKGIWLRPLKNILYVVPPYCTTQKELERCLDLLEETLIEMRDYD